MQMLNPNALLLWLVAGGAGRLIYGDAWHTVLFAVVAGGVSLVSDFVHRSLR